MQPVPTPTQPDPVPTPPEPAFALAASTPADGATAVARNTTFGASFNRAAAAASVTDSSARLFGSEGNAIPVAVSASGSDIGLTASQGLPGNTTYRVEFATSIADAKGSTLGNAVSRTFTTAVQTWQPAASELGSLTYSTANTEPIFDVIPRTSLHHIRSAGSSCYLINIAVLVHLLAELSICDDRGQEKEGTVVVAAGGEQLFIVNVRYRVLAAELGFRCLDCIDIPMAQDAIFDKGAP